MNLPADEIEAYVTNVVERAYAGDYGPWRLADLSVNSDEERWSITLQAQTSQAQFQRLSAVCRRVRDGVHLLSYSVEAWPRRAKAEGA